MAARAIALLFPGQASQYVGMGRDLHERSAAVRSIFERVERASGVEVRRLCFDGPEDELTLTPNLQPCLLAVGAAAWEFLRDQIDIQPKCAAGHSLGEYTALLAAGCLDLESAAILVRERGRLMQNAVTQGLGSMAAVMGLAADDIDEILRMIRRRGGKVWPANYNGGGQVVVSGLTRDLEEAIPELKAAGARRAVMLQVSAPFHSPLMEPAGQGFRPLLDRAALSDPAFTVYSNVHARPHGSAGGVADLLVSQITSPVLWEDIILRMEEEGVEVAIELGAGRVLTNLLQRTTDKIMGVSFDKPGDLDAVREAVV